MDIMALWQDPKPVIALPLQGQNKKEIIREFSYGIGEGAQVFEWRIDFLKDLSAENLKNIQRELNSVEKGYPLLITLRTGEQGGHKDFSFSEYCAFIRKLISLSLGTMIDIEYRQEEKLLLREMIEEAKAKKLYIVGSYHDFHQTPCAEEIVATLEEMWRWGVHLPKVAYMAHGEEDVEKVRQATSFLRKKNPFPCVAIAMGPWGASTRWQGDSVGTAMTYAKGEKNTAPGQLSLKELRNRIYESRMGEV